MPCSRSCRSSRDTHRPMPSDIASCTACSMRSRSASRRPCLTELRKILPYDPEHLPREVEFIRAARATFQENSAGGLF